MLSLNPCCDGRWPRTLDENCLYEYACNVLILVVMEDGLVQVAIAAYRSTLLES